MSRALKTIVISAIGVVAFLVLLAILTSGRVRHATTRTRCAINLKRISAAIYYYHMEYNSFPPTYVTGAGDNSIGMHSWRVLLLPYLDREDLYNAYNFHAAWNSLENSTVRLTHVSEFACPSNVGKRSADTNYLLVEGAHTSWAKDKPMKWKGFQQELSETALIVEVSQPGIIWLEPRDFDITKMNPAVNCTKGQCISSKHRGGAHVLLADGSVRFLIDSISIEELSSLLSVSDESFLTCTLLPASLKKKMAVGVFVQ